MLVAFGGLGLEFAHRQAQIPMWEAPLNSSKLLLIPRKILQVARIALLLMVTWAVMGFAQDKMAQDKGATGWGGLPDFSATEVRGAIHWNIHHSGSKLRVDASSAAATIWDPDEDRVYNLLLLPERKTCVVMKTAEAKVMRTPFQLAYGPNTIRTATAEKVTIDGHVCTLVTGVTTLAKGTINSKIWTADDLQGVPLEIDLVSGEPGGSEIAFYKNVVVGPQESFFVLPGKCIPPEKTYQVAPSKRPLPNQSNGDQKGPDQKTPPDPKP
jgi:hypothetical protein